MPQVHRRPSVDIASSSHVNQPASWGGKGDHSLTLPALNHFIRVDEIQLGREVHVRPSGRREVCRQRATGLIGAVREHSLALRGGEATNRAAPRNVKRQLCLLDKADHDPLYRFHQWQANLWILDVEAIKTVPYVPLSHPFVA
jgi:hypothetical protein